MDDSKDHEIIPSLRREWMILARRRRLVLAIPIIALMVAAVYNFAVLPVYEAAAIVSIGERLPGLAPGRRFADPQRMREVIGQETMRIGSVDFASAVIEQLGESERAELERGSLNGWWRRLRFLAAPALQGPVGPLAPARAVEALDSRLSVVWRDPSSWVEVRIVGYDAGAAAGLANAVAQTYLKETAEAGRESVQASQAALDTQLESRQKELGKQLSSLVDLGEETGVPRKTILQRQIQSYQDALVAARTERIGRAATRREMAALEGGALVASSNPRIQAAQDRLAALEDQEKTLLANLGALHPDVVSVREQIGAAKARLQAATQTEIKAANAAFDLALREETRIEDNLHRTQAELEKLEKESFEYTMSQKQADVSRLAVERLMQRQDASTPVPTVEASLIEAAVPPPDPSSPRPGRNLAYALVGGLLGGILLVWSLERFDDSIQSPDDVREVLGLPFLGVVPLTRALAQQPLKDAIADARTGFADSLRVVRTNLMFGSTVQRPCVLVFTSASPGDGKSTVATAVALLLQETRARVLLIDGDLRRPSVHELLQVPSSPGLADLLGGPPPVRLRVTADAASGIDVLPAGPSMIVSAAWLGSENMKSVLTQAREFYDWVIIDSPPSLGLPDASVLATQADAVVIVCSGDKTPRQALKSVADQLQGVGARVQGVVLNRVDLNRHSYYYGRYYSPYYGSDRRPAHSKEPGQDQIPPRAPAELESED